MSTIALANSLKFLVNKSILFWACFYPYRQGDEYGIAFYNRD